MESLDETTRETATAKLQATIHLGNARKAAVQESIASGTAEKLSDHEFMPETLLSPPSEDGAVTNAVKVICRRCSCVMFGANTGTLVKRNAVLGSGSFINWWKLGSMWDFDNIAVSKTVPESTETTPEGALEQPLTGAKYLCCADCESEVVGLMYPGEQAAYVAHARLGYKDVPLVQQKPDESSTATTATTS